MDLIILFFAIKLVKNLCQDLVWLARGEDPPSFRREQERRRLRATRGGPVTDRHEARLFWANAWHDAWESANARRQRRHDQRTREDKGAESDVAPMDVADPLKPVGRTPAGSPPGGGAVDADPASEPVWGLTPATVAGIKRQIAAEYAADNVREDEVLVRPNGEIVIDRRMRSPWAEPLTIGKWVPRADTVQRDEREADYQRYAMRRRNSGSVPDPNQLAEDLGVDTAEAQALHERWDNRYQQEIPSDAEVLQADAEDANYRRLREKSLAEWREHIALPEEEKQRLRDEVRARLAGAPLEDTDPDPARRFTSAFDAAVAAEEAGDTDRAQEHLVIAEEAATELGITTEEEMEEVLAAYGSSSARTRPATTPAPITASSINGTENDMSASGETTGLQAALTYTQQMATSSGEGAMSVETSIASLQAGEVSGEALAQLANAQEHLAAAQAAFAAANATLTSHQNVADAYGATPDAGNKEFSTNN